MNLNCVWKIASHWLRIDLDIILEVGPYIQRYVLLMPRKEWVAISESINIQSFTI